MYAGRGGQPFIAATNRLAACFAYVDGKPAWQGITRQNTIRLINNALLSIKDILSAADKNIPLQKQANLPSRAGSLVQISRSMAVYEHKETIEAALQEAYRAYQRHQPLFIRQRLHNNASLTNFLIHKNAVHMLDLSHIREDYAYSDLASLVISCLFFKIPVSTVRTVSKNYLAQHKIKTGYLTVLNTLVRIGLVAEYLKNTQREKHLDPSSYPPGLVRVYSSLLLKRKRSIITILKKLKENPRLLV
jgi:Ser/Thr protein kinase RdoA (MazF antagonist)